MDLKTFFKRFFKLFLKINNYIFIYPLSIAFTFYACYTCYLKNSIFVKTHLKPHSIDVQKNNFLIKPARFWKPARFCEVIYLKVYISKNAIFLCRGKSLVVALN